MKCAAMAALRRSDAWSDVSPRWTRHSQQVPEPAKGRASVGVGTGIILWKRPGMTSFRVPAAMVRASVHASMGDGGSLSLPLAPSRSLNSSVTPVHPAYQLTLVPQTLGLRSGHPGRSGQSTGVRVLCGPVEESSGAARRMVLRPHSSRAHPNDSQMAPRLNVTGNRKGRGVRK